MNLLPGTLVNEPMGHGSQVLLWRYHPASQPGEVEIFLSTNVNFLIYSAFQKKIIKSKVPVKIGVS